MRHVTAAVGASAFALSLGAIVSAQSAAIQIPKPPVAPKPGWTPPKTAWGDPDVSGNFTNKYEQGTPMERPAGFEGRGVDDVRGAELKKLLEDRQRQSDARQQFLAGDPTGRIAVLPEFGDRGEIVKGNRAWMVIDPADGKIPPMTETAQRRAPWRDQRRTGRAASSFSNTGFDSHEGNYAVRNMLSGERATEREAGGK